MTDAMLSIPNEVPGKAGLEPAARPDRHITA